jgi:hypothetical protein
MIKEKVLNSTYLEVLPIRLVQKCMIVINRLLFELLKLFMSLIVESEEKDFGKGMGD